MLPMNYENMMWYQKLDLFDPLSLLTWQQGGEMRLVPSREEAETIKLKPEVLEYSIAVQNYHAGYSSDACDALIASINADLASLLINEGKN